MRASALFVLRIGVFGLWASGGALRTSAADIPNLQREAVFHIEKGPLESALIQFSRQAEMQVVLAPDSGPHITASAVNGRLAVGEALTVLLKGTGLVYTALNNTVMVRVSDGKVRPLNEEKPIASNIDESGVAFRAFEPSKSAGQG